MFSFFPVLKDKSVSLKILVLLLLIAVFLLLSMIVGIIIAIPIFGFGIIESLENLTNFSDPETIRILKFFQLINQLGIFVLPAICYAYLENRKIGNYLTINKAPEIKPVIFSILLIIASIPAINWMVEVNEQMKLPVFLHELETWIKNNEIRNNKLTEIFLNVDTYSGLLINLIIIALFAAVGEELLFRGVLLRIFYDGFKNAHLAILISAILFSAMHMQFYGFLPRMVLGVLFGYVFIWTGRLWIPIVLHFLFNGITVVGAFLYNKGLIGTDAESLGSTHNNWIIVSSFAISLILLMLIYRGRNNLNELTK